MQSVNQNVFISIVVAVFNREKTLQRCIDSVVNQTYLYKELIIIDGGSFDGTIDILKLNNDKITYWKSEPDRGIYHAFNKGLEHIRGNWIYFLGSDDFLWDSQVLSRMAEELVASTNYDVRLVYGKVALVSPKGDVIELINQPWEQVKRRFFQGCYICHQGVFHHRSLFEIHGQFDESFQISGVYELLLRELKTRNALFFPNVIVAAMQIGGLSSSPKHTLTVLKEYARARRKNSVVVLPLEWSWSYVKALGRHMLSRTLGNENTKHLADFYRRLTGRNTLWTKL